MFWAFIHSFCLDRSRMYVHHKFKITNFTHCWNWLFFNKYIHKHTSAASRCILVWFERYGHPKKCAQKILVTFFLYIFQVKTKWHIVYQYLKTKIFLRDTNIPPQMHWISNVFGHSATTTGVFWVPRNFPIFNFKKTACPKNVWMQ